MSTFVWLWRFWPESQAPQSDADRSSPSLSTILDHKTYGLSTEPGDYVDGYSRY